MQGFQGPERPNGRIYSAPAFCEFLPFFSVLRLSVIGQGKCSSILTTGAYFFKWVGGGSTTNSKQRMHFPHLLDVLGCFQGGVGSTSVTSLKEFSSEGCGTPKGHHWGSAKVERGGRVF